VETNDLGKKKCAKRKHSCPNTDVLSSLDFLASGLSGLIYHPTFDKLQ
jgi:hypothetical protein